jgi:hypothetical protein
VKPLSAFGLPKEGFESREALLVLMSHLAAKADEVEAGTLPGGGDQSAGGYVHIPPDIEDAGGENDEGVIGADSAADDAGPGSIFTGLAGVRHVPDKVIPEIPPAEAADRAEFTNEGVPLRSGAGGKDITAKEGGCHLGPEVVDIPVIVIEMGLRLSFSHDIAVDVGPDGDVRGQFAGPAGGIDVSADEGVGADLPEEAVHEVIVAKPGGLIHQEATEPEPVVLFDGRPGEAWVGDADGHQSHGVTVVHQGADKLPGPVAGAMENGGILRRQGTDTENEDSHGSREYAFGHGFGKPWNRITQYNPAGSKKQGGSRVSPAASMRVRLFSGQPHRAGGRSA